MLCVHLGPEGSNQLTSCIPEFYFMNQTPLDCDIILQSTTENFHRGIRVMDLSTRKRRVIAGVISGFLMAVLVISNTLYLTRGHVFSSLFAVVTIVATILGYMLSGYIVARYVSNIKKKGGRVGCIICSVLIVPISIYDGIALGTIGGGYGELLIGETGIYIGIPIAITLGIVLIECIGALFGALLGSFGQSLWQRYSRHAAI